MDIDYGLVGMGLWMCLLFGWCLYNTLCLSSRMIENHARLVLGINVESNAWDYFAVIISWVVFFGQLLLYVSKLIESCN